MRSIAAHYLETGSGGGESKRRAQYNRTQSRGWGERRTWGQVVREGEWEGDGSSVEDAGDRRELQGGPQWTMDLAKIRPLFGRVDIAGLGPFGKPLRKHLEEVNLFEMLT